MKHTILVTGGTGYLGSWVVKGLLEKGHTVRLTVRNKDNKERYQFLQDIAEKSKGKLEIWEADLLKEGSFDEPVKECDLVAHMASPFTIKVKDPQRDLLDPAVKGTMNVFNAVNRSGSVKKVVLTSSVAAVYGDNADMKDQNISAFTEEHFNKTSSLKHQPYSYSKTKAEKTAWEITEKQTGWELVVLNPSLVMGPPLTKNSNSESIKIMTDILKGKYRSGAPEIFFGFVDVRDVAKAHIFCLENNAEGRHILAERVTDMLSFINIIKKYYGNTYKLPRSYAPKWILELTAPLFGITGKFIKKNAGYKIMFDTSKSKEKLRMNYIPLDETVKDMVEKMKLFGMVK